MIPVKKYEPLDYRNLTLLAHLGNMYVPLTFPDAQPPALETLRPYKVPWGLFALHVCHAAIPNSQIMNVLNGSVVALCHVSESDILVGDNMLVSTCIRFHVNILAVHSHCPIPIKCPIPIILLYIPMEPTLKSESDQSV